MKLSILDNLRNDLFHDNVQFFTLNKNNLLRKQQEITRESFDSNSYQ